jgi:hypothetical protein
MPFDPAAMVPVARPGQGGASLANATPVHFGIGFNPFEEQAKVAALALAATPLLLVGGPTPATPVAAAMPAAAAMPVDPAPAAFVPPTPLRRRPQFEMLPFVEAHWQGLEMIQLTPALSKALGLDPTLKGIIADDVTPPADACLFQGGDIVLSVNGIPTPDLASFLAASETIRDEQKVSMMVQRKGQVFPLNLWSLKGPLGNANGDTAPMIPAGSVSPHAYQGKCTGCHRIGTKGQLPVDQGDLLALTAPPIRAGMKRLHRDRGPCVTCHQILP